MTPTTQSSSQRAATISLAEARYNADPNETQAEPTAASGNSSSNPQLPPPPSPSLTPEWPLSSPYYNPLIMRSSVIRDLNANLIYTDDLLFCVRKKENSIDNDLEAHATNICELLREADQPSKNPFSVPLTVVKRYLSCLEYQKRRLQHSVIMIERLTGHGAVTYLNRDPAETDPKSFDIPNLYWIGANQRDVVYGLNFQVRLTAFLQGAHWQLTSLRSGKELNFIEMPVQDKCMQEALAAHYTNVAGVLDDSRVTSERGQAQLSNVSYQTFTCYEIVFLVTPKQADSIVNTMIAKQAQRTADETRKDSTSMKTIASLTMVYLPSTFAATLFSSTFFTFGGAGTLTVNTDIWKFIVVAAVLTGITIFVWTWLNKFGVPIWLKWAQSQPQQAVGRKRKIMTYTNGPGISAANAAVGDAQFAANV
ncbi:hypothetical protein FH972_021283 [Carpinus fangiana]|uniref:Uncharacterized protein n=1 Tax=Carpinus fangiana TaxID=176857 RepID=A0A5N6KPG6_9ROSI|nr:hypothetical protein FH972_021283 [Carpinus fangiana]